MLAVTFTQWCKEEGLDQPSTFRNEKSLPIHSLQESDSDDDSDHPLTNHHGSSGIIESGGHTFSVNQLDQVTEHMICYMAKKDNKDSKYPKCDICQLPGHTVENCHPLINVALAQAFLKKEPKVLAQILKKYKSIPRGSRGPRKKGGRSKVHSLEEMIAALEITPDSPDTSPSSSPPPDGSMKTITFADGAYTISSVTEEGPTSICYHEQALV